MDRFCNDNITVNDADMLMHISDESYLDSFKQLMDGVVISCTANYTDGTKKTVFLNAGAYYGSPTDMNSDNTDTASSENRILFTLELQP
nr:hypothetical protein [Roseburia sp.]